jgi:hypothetical protein
MDTATNSVVIFIDDQRIELTGKDAVEYEAKRAIDHQCFLDNQKKIEENNVAKLAAQAKLEALGLTTDDLKALGL